MYNERAEWTRKEERRKISNMVLTRINETATFLSKAHSLKFRGSDQRQNYRLKALTAAHKAITSKTDNVCSNVTFWPSYKLFHIVNRNLVGKL
jgi:hypothetical protein